MPSPRKITRLLRVTPCPRPIWAALLVVGMASAHKVGFGADWQFEPRITVTERYSDNVALAPTNEQEDFVTELSPGISVGRSGKRLRFQGDLELQNVFFASGDFNGQTNPKLTANANATLVENFFFLDAAANIRRDNTSLLGPVGTADTNASGNVSTFRSTQISPYLRKRFGTAANATARYTASYTNSDAATFSSSTSNRIELDVVNGEQFEEVTWATRYSAEKIDYSNFQDTEFQRIDLTGGYRVRPRVRLTGSIGYEKNDLFTIGERPEGSIWSVGVAWTPTPRTSVDFSGGERFFGNTYSFNFQHRRRHSTWRVRYAEDIQTTRAQLLIPGGASTAAFLDSMLAGQFPDPAVRAVEVANRITQNGLPPVIIEPFGLVSNLTFLERSLDATMGYDISKSTIVAGVTAVERDTTQLQSFSSPGTGVGDFGTSRIVRDTGVRLAWGLRLNEVTRLSTTLGFNKIKFPDIAREDDVGRGGVGVVRQFPRNATGSIEYRYARRSSDDPGAEFTENSLLAIFTKRF